MKKLTKTNFKTFIKKNAANLHVEVNSRFSGMDDCVMSVEDTFSPAEATNYHTEHTYGISGVWLVGGGRDWFSPFENEKFIGIHVSNSCGSFNVAIPKEKPDTHTPGPWFYAGERPVCVVDSEGYTIADVALNRDALLIVQAPQLLKELKRWQKFAKDNNWTDADYHDADGTGWISSMNTAITRTQEE